MGNSTFSARHWLFNETTSDKQDMEENDSLMSELLMSLNYNNTQYSSSQNTALEEDNFILGKYFKNGWLGEDLLSKNGTEIHKILKYIDQDVTSRFTQINPNKTFRLSIYNEFLLFAEEYVLNCPELDNHLSFWQHLTDENSPHHKILSEFFKVYCARVALIYFCKVRFISILARESGITISNKDLLHPNSFFTTVFKKNGLSELKSEAIKSNQYSWYSPSPEMTDIISLIPNYISDIQIEELFEITSRHKQPSEEFYKSNPRSSEISHELSHKHFGNFLTSLILSMPQWLNRNLHNESYNRSFHHQGTLDVITTKFSGDYLESISRSHLLAQESNKYIRWKQIICAEFSDPNFESGQFLKIMFELHFLCFLASNAKKQLGTPQTDIISFLCNTVNDIKTNQTIDSAKQTFLLAPEIDPASAIKKYDRIVLNLVNLPKRNPHNSLTNAIIKEKENLKQKGHLIVFSTQKLFVPSQKKRVDQLLSDYNMECYFTLKHLQGRGKIAPYIYILTRRPENSGFKAASFEERKKRPCLSFRFQGELGSINDLSALIYEMENFIHKNYDCIPPLFLKELNSFKFDFHQDAIVDGRLVNFTSKDSSKITHPVFFDKLLKSCMPLSNFFTLKKIDPPRNEFHKMDFNDSTIENNAIFGNNYFNSFDPYVIIIDTRDPNSTNLELIHQESFKSKAEEYGFALCHYFGLTPKFKSINLNIFREFFNSRIGRQLIDLTFTERTHKLKEKLSSLLLPVFFGNQKQMPEDIEKGMSILNLQSEEILSIHPDQLKSDFRRIEQFLQLLKSKYPHRIMGKLSVFAITLQNCMDTFNGSTSNKINFNNPIISKPLLESKTRKILPNNEDVYVDLHSKNIGARLSSHVIKHHRAGDKNLSSIEIYAEDEIIVSLHTDRVMAEFIDYILQQAQNYPISSVVQGIEVPKLEELQQIVGKYNNLKSELDKLHGQCRQIIDSIFIEQISI